MWLYTSADKKTGRSVSVIEPDDFREESEADVIGLGVVTWPPCLIHLNIHIPQNPH